MQSMKGEEIFESDVAIDSVAAANQLNQFRDGIIDRPTNYDKEGVVVASVRPEDAFQVFNGKLFNVPRTEYSLADSVERRVESPLQRYSRLRIELDQLKSDLDSMATAESANSSSIWSVLQQETGKLVAVTETLGRHESLLQLQRTIDGKENVISNIVNEVKTTSASPESSSSRVVSLTDAEFLALEQRVHTLETVLGYSHNSTDVAAALSSGKTIAQSFPLMDTIAKLEQRVSMFDSVNLETLRAKTAALKADLEATLKLKSASGAGGAADKLAESVRKVDDLLESLKKVEVVAEDLPSIVVRLKTLEKVHLSASTFASRLNLIESEVKAVAGDLKSNREVLGELKNGLAENMSVVQQNVAAMDSRLAALAKK